MSQLRSWAQRHTTTQDLFVLEASGNSFQVVRALADLEGVRPLVLESCQLGKLGEAHANNDKISAVPHRQGVPSLQHRQGQRLVPDPKTQERGTTGSMPTAKAVKRTTQMRNRLLSSYLERPGLMACGSPRARAWPKVRRPKPNCACAKTGRPASGKCWKACSWNNATADEQRSHWRSLIAQELADPPSSCPSSACAASAKWRPSPWLPSSAKIFTALPSRSNWSNMHVGLNPAFDAQRRGASGPAASQATGAWGPDCSGLLIEAAQAIMRSTHPLAKWGKKLLARKGSVNLAVAAVARKLAVAIWYLMMGRWTPLEDIDERLAIKVGKILTSVGAKGLQQLGQTRKALRDAGNLPRAQGQPGLLAGSPHNLQTGHK